MDAVTAIVSREPDQPLALNWSLEQVEVRPPGDDEVLVQIHASGICHTDIVLSAVPGGTLGIEYPKVVGHEGAGIVLTVGKNVHSVEAGDPVLLSFSSCSACAQCLASHPAYCDSFASRNYVGQQGSMRTNNDSKPLWSQFFGQSSFAQYSTVHKSTIVNAKALIRDPSELKLFAPLGCGFQTGMGAVQNITQAGPNDVVMISGLGAVGMGALMTAKIIGCKTIIAVDRMKSRLELAKEIGATHAIDTSDSKFSTLDSAVRSIVPMGASVAIDTTGVPFIIEQSIQSTHARGKVVYIGIPPLDFTLNINLVEHINDIPQMIQWYREGKFPLDRFVQYFEVRYHILRLGQSTDPKEQAADYSKALAGLKDGRFIKPVLVWSH
ncbi:unnamed protein product [Penicillium salamii]|uniref:Enoyl reductase (ER) domain-containing protein n=1 Tax=Penicillium salamii TaxID=1612424 RepID=A0A9W4IY86_9EURO|nr:unnamed protein product [Penicillium salamii]